MYVTDSAIVTLAATAAVNDEDVAAALQDIWENLRSNPSARSEAARAGFRMDDQISPFRVEREGAQFGVGETILVFLASEAAHAVIGELVDFAWKKLFWPRLEQRFGARLSPRDHQDDS